MWEGGRVSEPNAPSCPAVARWRTATPDDIDVIHGVLVAADRGGLVGGDGAAVALDDA